MNKLGKQEFLAQFSKNVHGAIIDAVKRYPDCEAVVCFENVDLCSSSLGERKALVVGPSNTFESVEFCKDKHLGDLPSQRLYPQTYCTRDDMLS